MVHVVSGQLMNQQDPSGMPSDGIPNEWKPNDWITSEIHSRLSRLASAIGIDQDELVVAAGNTLANHPSWASGQADLQLGSRPWIAVVSSHLGHNPVLHRDVCRNLAQAMIQCRRRNGVLLVAEGSAIQPWAMRAAELFGVPVIQIVVGVDEAASDTLTLRIQTPDSVNLLRDEAVVYLADRVDAVYVRCKGKIAQAVSARVKTRQDATTRVATTSLPKCAAKELIQAGAIGWIHIQHVQAQVQVQPLDHEPTFADDWMHQDGEWLIHCTRACDGAWPGQTESQYRDELLLNADAPVRPPLETLQRIIRSRRLIASAIASTKAYPVVCFSSVALADLLIARSYRPHLKRWDYEPWGIAIRKSAAISTGVQQVIYGVATDRKQIRAADQFRFQAVGKTYDWTSEKEWRFEGDLRLDALDPSDLRVFVASSSGKQQIEKHCPWKISVV